MRADGRGLTPSEQEVISRATIELDQLDEQIRSMIDAENRGREADQAFQTLASAGPEYRTQNPQLRAFLRGDVGAPRVLDVKPEGTVDFRTLSKLTAGAGGNTVPTSFYGRLMEHLIDSSAIMRAGPTVFNTDSGEALQVPKTTAHSTAAIVTETSQIGPSDPAFGQLTLGAYKYALMMFLSRELVEDNGVDLEGYLSRQAGRALGNAFGANAITGTGTGQPRGILTDSVLGVTGGAGAAPTADQIISLFHSVIPSYRNSPSCTWIMRDSTWASIRSLKDTTNQYLIGPLASGVDMQLLGKPVVIDSAVPAVGAGAKSVIFGDVSAYAVRLAGGVRFERSDDFKFDTDIVSYRAILRADGATVDLTGALKHYASA